MGTMDADLNVPYRRHQYQDPSSSSGWRHQGPSSNHLQPQAQHLRQHMDSGVDAKVVVMGSTAVGKTSLVRRYAEDKFAPASTTSTTGAFFVTKKVLVDGLRVRLQLWDTAGQERFRSMAPMYYRGAHAAILVYDITDASTFADIRIWLEELKSYHPTPTSSTPPPLPSDDNDESLIIYVVGTKADLAPNKRAVSLEYARRTISEWFPPPPPSTFPTTFPNSSASKLPPSRVERARSYIRPRFTSLTSFSSSTSTSAASALAAPKIKPLTRATSTMAVPTRSTGGALRREPRERRWSDAMMLEEPEDDEDGGADTPPSSNPFSEDDDCRGGEVPRLQKGMELFEVSAKDGDGVDALFGRLVREIIRRREAIALDKERKERGSVFIGGSEQGVQDGDDEDDSVRSMPVGAKSGGGWGSCCST